MDPFRGRRVQPKNPATICAPPIPKSQRRERCARSLVRQRHSLPATFQQKVRSVGKVLHAHGRNWGDLMNDPGKDGEQRRLSRRERFTRHRILILLQIDQQYPGPERAP
jgi:hypothetical protein